MTHILAVPDFARGPGLLSEIRGAVKSINNVSRRLIPRPITGSQDSQEV